MSHTVSVQEYEEIKKQLEEQKNKVDSENEEIMVKHFIENINMRLSIGYLDGRLKPFFPGSNYDIFADNPKLLKRVTSRVINYFNKSTEWNIKFGVICSDRFEYFEWKLKPKTKKRSIFEYFMAYFR
jgi:hypothetical protein